ncbi:MAG TPA: glycosyltransferase, partial [Rhabdochlamydiaceae bacterium]|nr:glycosyltransferase [Rhabdochlamydiaceae bacterium]
MRLPMWKINQFLLSVSCFIFLPIFCFSEDNDFEVSMGKGTELWQYVQTPEDLSRLDFFKKNYNLHIAALEQKETTPKIPQVLHFIWLGPREFPIASLEKIEKWIELHPDWTIKFWTDINRAPPLKKMKKQLVEDFTFQVLSDAYYQSDNFGEKAKILCYEILFQEGGLYTDHDVKPCTSLENLNQALDFYCGLEKLGPSILSSSIHAASHLIAARPHHPILRETLVWLKENWKKLEESYPGQSKSAIRNRFAHRTLWALSEGVNRKLSAQEEKTVDIVFPSSY